MALAIFDLDETLLGIDSDHAWGEYLVDNGLVDGENYRHQNQAFFDAYKRGEMDVDAYLKFSCSALTQHTPTVLHEHRAIFVKQRIQPYILSKGADLINHHKAQGDTLIVVTATIDFITQPIVSLMGIENLIAPNVEIIDGKYTGALTGIPSMGQGKVTRLKAWLAGKAFKLDDSYFYSDSINDLPLLEAVANPTAVDPDAKLLAIATAKNWPVISLR